MANVVARSTDGVRFEPVAEVTKDRFGAESLERPALVHTPEGRWRLYVSCATPGTKHWWVDVLEADTPEGLADAPRRTVLPGSDRHAVKDPVVLHSGGLWHLWASVHPLDLPQHEDRMTTEYATSPDGLDWTWRGTALAPTPGAWDARGVRVSAVFEAPGGLAATYDGRASAAENWEERTGLALPARRSGLLRIAVGDAPVAESPEGLRGLRYLSVVAAARRRLPALLRGDPRRRGARPAHRAALPAPLDEAGSRPRRGPGRRLTGVPGRYPPTVPLVGVVTGGVHGSAVARSRSHSASTCSRPVVTPPIATRMA